MRVTRLNPLWVSGRIHDGASGPRKTVASFHSFYGLGRRTSRGACAPPLSFAGAGGGWGKCS